jgi:hypothetical protein
VTESGQESIKVFREAVRESFSIAQVLRKLGLKPAGGNYAIFKRRVRLWGIDTSSLSELSRDDSNVSRKKQAPKIGRHVGNGVVVRCKFGETPVHYGRGNAEPSASRNCDAKV